MPNRINIFDFDGTIAESNLLKTDAFRYAASGYGQEISEWFVGYHKVNGGITRQVKIETLCQKINNASAYDELLARYENYLEKEWLSCSLLPGFRAYIETLSGVNIILSGGSKVEIEAYLKANNLDQYFLEVFGNPIDKHVNLETIKDKYLNEESDVYFYGDSQLDFELSEAIKSKFVFVSWVSEWVTWASYKDAFFTVLEVFGERNERRVI